MKVPSIRELREVAQPPSVIGRPSEEHWSGRYMRRVSIHVTRVALRLGLGANGVTALMLVVGVASAALLFVGGLWPALVAVGGVQAYLLLDCVDGEVARWTKTESAVGIYLDRVSHYLVEGTLLAGLGWRAGGGVAGPWFAAGLAGALGVLLARIETDLVDSARAKAGLTAARDAPAERPAGLRAARRLADFLPLHRLTGALEASVVIGAAAVADRVRGDLVVSRWAVAILAAIAGAVALLHLVSILASDRLR